MSTGTKVGIGVGLGAAALVVVLVLTMVPGVTSGTMFGSPVQSNAPLDLSDADLNALGTRLWQPTSIWKWFRFDDAVPTNQLNETYQKFVSAVSPSGGLVYSPVSQQMYLVNAALKEFTNITISPEELAKGNLFFFENAAFRQVHYIKMLPSANAQFNDVTVNDWVMFQPRGIPFAYLVPAVSFDRAAALSSGLFGVSYTIR